MAGADPFEVDFEVVEEWRQVLKAWRPVPHPSIGVVGALDVAITALEGVLGYGPEFHPLPELTEAEQAAIVDSVKLSSYRGTYTKAQVAGWVADFAGTKRDGLQVLASMKRMTLRSQVAGRVLETRLAKEVA